MAVAQFAAVLPTHPGSCALGSRKFLVSDNLPILIVTADNKLRDELLSALESLSADAPVVNTATTARQALESARSRQPQLVILEMSTDLEALRTFTVDLKNAAPGVSIAAVVRPEVMNTDVSESGIIIAALRAGVSDFLRRPISSAELGELLVRFRRQAAPLPAVRGRVISFISNKGGVGKSTMAVNAAVGLALRHPDRVLLIDASLQMGVASSMLDLRPAVTLTDAARERSRLDETMLRQMVTVHPCGLHLLAAPADAVEAADIDDEIISRTITLAGRVYDYVVVDTFPLFDRVVVAILDLSDRAYVVVENVVPTVQGAAQLLDVLHRIGFPRERQRIILNRMTSLAGGLTAVDVANRLEAPIDHVLPYSTQVILAANTGQPYMLRSGSFFDRFNRFITAFNGLIVELEALSKPRENLTAGVVPLSTSSPPVRSAETMPLANLEFTDGPRP